MTPYTTCSIVRYREYVFLPARISRARGRHQIPDNSQHML